MRPGTFYAVTVTNGHYAVSLADATMDGIGSTVFPDNADVRLGIWFSTAPGGPFGQLAPDHRITAAEHH